MVLWFGLVIFLLRGIATYPRWLVGFRQARRNPGNASFPDFTRLALGYCTSETVSLAVIPWDRAVQPLGGSQLLRGEATLLGWVDVSGVTPIRL